MTYQGRREQEADAEWRVVIGPICGNNKPISPIIKTRGHIFMFEPQIPKHRSLTHATFLTHLPDLDALLAPYEGKIGPAFYGIQKSCVEDVEFCFISPIQRKKARKKLIIAGAFMTSESGQQARWITWRLQ